MSDTESLARTIVENTERGVQWRTRARLGGTIDVVGMRDGKQVATFASDIDPDCYTSRAWVAEALAFGPDDIAGLLSIIDGLRSPTRIREILEDALDCCRQADRTFEQDREQCELEHRRRHGSVHQAIPYIRQRRPVGISQACAKIERALALLAEVES